MDVLTASNGVADGSRVDIARDSQLLSGGGIGNAAAAPGYADLLFDDNPIAIWIIDVATLGLVAVNDAACDLYGYCRNQILLKNLFDIWPETDLGDILSVGADAEDRFHLEQLTTQVRAGGDRIRVLLFARKTMYQGRDCIVAWNIDMTVREQASIELKSTQIFLDAIVESIPSMVFVKDALDGRFVLLNRAGEELLGIGRADLIGKTDFDLFDREDAQRFREADRAVVASGKLVAIENEPLTTPEGVRSLRTQKVGVPDANGKPRYLLGISEDVTEKLRADERSRHLSLHDILTDLPNRLQFQDLMIRALQTPDHLDFALILLDLDRFKSVNDSFGHDAGDELLRQVAARLLIRKSDQDVVARLGGDEFGVLHRGPVNSETASRLARRLIAALCEPFEIDGHILSIGCSAGLALKSEHGGSADALMKRADLALYAAKAAGGSDFAWFAPKMEEKADRARTLRDELAHALERQQLYLEYQPIICIRSGKIVCCEALMRWRHPVRGLVPPLEFIPVAEASGLIEPIGRWALQQACEAAATWPGSVKVAVNLSPRQFSGMGLVADVVHILKLSGLPPHRLELEITESVLLADTQENVRILNQIQKLGVQVALDDFGTGYSSLAYLRCFSFNKLKIDRSFVGDLAVSKENLAIVRAVIGLGKSFGATVTAEGVETEEQRACLAQEGCDQAQGYLFGRPITADAIGDMLRDHGH